MEHYFKSSREAYDLCQTSARIGDGDTLIIESECVVGLAWTWPVAITPTYNELHTPSSDSNLVHLMQVAHWTPEQIATAVAAAESRGYSVVSFFKQALT